MIQEDNEEWGEYIKDFFKYLDSNEDGQLSTDEFKHFFEGPPESEEPIVEHEEEPF